MREFSEQRRRPIEAMANRQCEFLIYGPGGPSQARRRNFLPTDYVEVVDLTTQAVLKIRAGDVSPYRHTLILDGKRFRIVNILK